VRRFAQDNLRAPARYGAQAMSCDEITLRSRPKVQASMIRPYVIWRDNHVGVCGL